jgi:hypothetical protein
VEDMSKVEKVMTKIKMIKAKFFSMATSSNFNHPSPRGIARILPFIGCPEIFLRQILKSEAKSGTCQTGMISPETVWPMVRIPIDLSPW